MHISDKSTKPDIKPLQMLSNIYNANGFRGLFAGVTPRIIKISPACAIMVATFEYGKSFFYLRNINASKPHASKLERNIMIAN